MDYSNFRDFDAEAEVVATEDAGNQQITLNDIFEQFQSLPPFITNMYLYKIS